MVSVDEHTQVAMEIVSQGTKLSGELLLKVLKALNDLLSSDDKQKDFIIKDNSKEGKQKINDLINKHKDGVVALDENITKQQLKDYQKEFKKLGVDFSVVKNGKDDYSFFFAGQQTNVIEKALKNVIEKKERAKENEKEKPKQKKVDFSMNGVAKLDKKIKEEQKEVSKDKQKTQSISR
ncbi:MULTISPECIES: DUF3801 domain-containing protein [Bacillus]|uniref:DUF3801 domain-containing protein n=1 Tax=Bacillus TaxID=1386 RepID=UPI00091D62FE|nr:MULTISPECIES: DUF3801 domain-containing protein [Bacillus]MCU5490331.1 PcfB family protein [Bacillus cereus]MED3269724.1 DUF3801 domain-containing protein [Bacillus thuringiensis]OPA06719.1 hypothetical protein BHL54_26245 [Bacillus cereus]PFB40379.1 DUF3801 domain-containing protein [Bacillus thuringiensis]PFE91160.1 DUF3801 domain-containing protein [Bacillus thuringiensis]